MTTAADLKPCPFCGSDQITIKPNVYTKLDRVVCESCWAVSVCSNNRQTVIAAWNRRAPVTLDEWEDSQ